LRASNPILLDYQEELLRGAEHTGEALALLPAHSRNAFTGRAGLKRFGHGAAREMACVGPERLKHFALGYGGDGCTIAKQSPAG